MPRLTAGLIAAIAWAALAIQFNASLKQLGSAGEAVWVMLRFFTVLTNLLAAIVFTLLALGTRVRPFLVGGTVLAILLVGIVYMTLLRGMLELSGGALLADTLLHKVTPALVPLWWLAFAPKGHLQWRAPLGWAAYPLVYFAYALLRGAADGNYAYPFIDVGRLGLGAVLINAALIACAFLLAGFGLVALDHRLAQAGVKR